MKILVLKPADDRGTYMGGIEGQKGSHVSHDLAAVYGNALIPYFQELGIEVEFFERSQREEFIRRTTRP